MQKQNKTIRFHNITSFLRGQASRIFTSISEKDDAALVLKNGKPIAVVISFQRYERIMESGVNVLDY